MKARMQNIFIIYPTNARQMGRCLLRADLPAVARRGAGPFGSCSPSVLRKSRKICRNSEGESELLVAQALELSWLSKTISHVTTF